ncbi:outer membrane protein C [endosymbiont of Euscepes postfasciatus]|uniref:porin n=1 Tax=endosymbiont of Euscepes postfasciatus TaxID=650377 RepID=UPI000DC6F5C9|nr:porin [endosymbiont of Euscepes postfasciatus]BBA84721.1 outer membrane protein C [endosymbiont of Euscepes postfasciatus]
MFNIFKLFIIIVLLLINISTSYSSEYYNSDIEQTYRILKRKIMKYDLSEDFGENTKMSAEIKIKSEINDSISLLNKLSNDMYCNNINDNNTFLISKLKNGYMEIIHDKYGRFSYGKNNGVMRDVFDVHNEIPFSNNEYNSFDNFMFNRSNNVVSYKNDNLFELVNGLSTNIQFQFKNDSTIHRRNRKIIKYSNGIGCGYSLTYNISDFTVSAAFTQSERNVDQMMIDIDQLKNKYASSYGVAFKYDNDNIYIASLYANSKFMMPYGNINNHYIRHYIFEEASILRKYYYCGFAPTVDTIEIMAKLKFIKNIYPYILYMNIFSKNIKNDLDQYLTKSLNFGIDYKINEDISIIANLCINFLKENSFTKNVEINVDNTFSLETIYKF